MIERYRFGELVADGKRYTADVVITPKGVSGWWRQEGHRVAVADLEPFLSSSPEVCGGYWGQRVDGGIA
jgi:hypothetical protein